MNNDNNVINTFKKISFLGLLLDEVDDPVVFLNQDLIITHINKACLDSLEFSSSDLLGMPFSRLIQSSEIGEVEGILLNCMKLPGDRVSFKHTAVSKNGHVEFYKTSAVSGKLSGRKSSIMLHMKNISEQNSNRELAATTALLYEAIAEQASECFFMHDFNGRLVQVNKKACDLLGYTREELLKMTVMDIEQDFTLESAQGEWQKIEPGVHFTLTGHHKRKDGTGFPVLVSFGSVFLNGQKHYIAFARDMTDIVQTEEALKKSEQRYEALFQSLTTPAILSSLKDRKIVEVNDAWTQLFGFDREEAIGKCDKDLSDAVEALESERFFNELIEKKVVKNIEIEMLTKSGERLTLLFNACIMKFENTDYVLIAYQDITKRKQVEKKVIEVNERFKNIFDYSALGMCLSNEKGILVDVNRRMCSMFGYSKGELEGRHFNDFTFTEDVAMSNAVVGRLISDEVKILSFEKRYVRKNGEVFWAAVTTTALRGLDGKLEHFITQIQDITERKKMEQELIAKEKLSRAVMDNLPIGIAVNSLFPAVEFQYMNDNFPRFYRTTREELSTPDSFWEAVYEDPEFRENLKNRVLTDAQSGDKERMHWENIPITRRGEETSYISAYNTDIPGENYQISIVTDETERVRTLETLTKNAKRLKRLHDFDQEVIKGFGSYKSIGETVLTYIMELIVPDTANILICDSKEHILVSITPEQGSYEFKCFKADFPEEEIKKLILSDTIDVYKLSELPDCVLKKLIYESTKSEMGLICPLFSTDGPAGLIYINRADDMFTVTDIEVLQEIGIQAALSIEQKRLQLQNEGYALSLEKLVKDRTAQLEAAVKELEAFTYSVSHDLRAPLRSVSGFVRILMEDYGAKLDQEGQRICNIISSSAQQMGCLIDDLLSLSKVGRISLNMMPVNMQAMVKELFIELTNERLRARIDFSVGELPAAEADPTLIRQVWTNLIDNAIKFSSKVPVARIRIGATATENEYIFSISDNGAGFDMKYQNKLFGIFQRLHSAADFEGTGVGLAIVQRIVVRHGGRVWAQAEENIGAEFCFSLRKGS